MINKRSDSADETPSSLVAQDDAAQDAQHDEESRRAYGELEQRLLESTPGALDGIRTASKRPAERGAFGLQKDDRDQHDGDNDGNQVECNIHEAGDPSQGNPA